MNLALFDFDGTITNKDSFTAFLRFAIPPKRQVIAYVCLLPFILGYKAGLVPATSMRKMMVRVGLFGMSAKDYQELGRQFAKNHIPAWVRKKAIERINWHLSSGDKVVVVSASLDGYLSPWCRELGIDLICSNLESINNKLTGRYIKGDCTGSEKAKRVLSLYPIKNFEKIYAYGDTQEDEDLLALGHEAYYQWRKLKPNPPTDLSGSS